jgi:hypothetical protein
MPSRSNSAVIGQWLKASSTLRISKSKRVGQFVHDTCGDLPKAVNAAAGTAADCPAMSGQPERAGHDFDVPRRAQAPKRTAHRRPDDRSRKRSKNPQIAASMSGSQQSRHQ